MRRMSNIFLWIALTMYILVLVKYLILDRIRYIFYGFDRMYNLYPFHSIREYLTNFEHYNLNIIIMNLIGNLLMLSPLGVLMPLMFTKFRKTPRFITFIFVLNLSIEIIQIITSLGSFDIDDIILNCTGALIAYGLTRLMIRIPSINKIFIFSYK